MRKSESDVQFCININIKKRNHTVDSVTEHQLDLICTSCLHLGEYLISRHMAQLFFLQCITWDLLQELFTIVISLSTLCIT